MLKELLERIRERKAREKEYEADLRIQHRVNDRMQSPDERELNGYMEEERQRRIKEQVMQFRQKKKDEQFKGGQLLHAKNIFKEDPKKNLMKTPNIFMLNGGTKI